MTIASKLSAIGNSWEKANDLRPDITRGGGPKKPDFLILMAAIRPQPGLFAAFAALRPAPSRWGRERQVQPPCPPLDGSAPKKPRPTGRRKCGSAASPRCARFR